MAIKAAKRTKLLVTYNGKNITEELEDFLLNWNITDNLSGEIDDLNINLEDTEALWLQTWFPSKGATIEPVILREHWATKSFATKIGLFEIDEVNGTNSIITINAMATSQNSSLRGEEKCAAWEKTNLKTVMSTIAKKNKMTLVWQTSENPKKDRYEQDNQTDLAFLHEQCKEEGLCLKIASNKIIVLDEKDYENQPAVEVINRIPKETDIIKIIDYSFKTTLTDIYAACRVQHHNTSKKKNIKATFNAPNAPKTGRTLVIKQEVKSQAEALKLARKVLREKNKNAITFTLEVLSQIHIDAGMAFILKGFGSLNGKYIAYKVIHSPGGCTLNLRQCLEGY